MFAQHAANCNPWTFAVVLAFYMHYYYYYHDYYYYYYNYMILSLCSIVVECDGYGLYQTSINNIFIILCVLYFILFIHALNPLHYYLRRFIIFLYVCICVLIIKSNPGKSFTVSFFFSD